MKNHSNNNTTYYLILLLSILFFAFCELGFCKDHEFIKMKKTLGGFKGTQNSAEIESIALFAVQEHNMKENSLLEFARVVKANEQVVAGKMYHLTLEATDDGKKKIYEAKVWVKPWMNFKQLQEFKHADYAPLLTSSDLGVIRGNANLYVLWKTYGHKDYRTIIM